MLASENLGAPACSAASFHIGRQVPALKLDLSANAIGKDYRALSDPVGVWASGAGVQLNLLGLLGVNAGWQEGIEFNVLALNFGLDMNPPALRLPFIGHLGFGQVSASGPRATAPSQPTVLAPSTRPAPVGQ